MAWLEKRLEDGEAVPARTLFEEAKAAGIVHSDRALGRAAEQIGVHRFKEREFGGKWLWRLQDRLESNQ